jgi:hypothetical protein
LKDTGVQLLDLRDNWVEVEDQRIEMRQRSESEDESGMEKEEVHRKRKRQGNNRKGRQEDDSIHEREIQALRKLVRNNSSNFRE